MLLHILVLLCEVKQQLVGERLLIFWFLPWLSCFSVLYWIISAFLSWWLRQSVECWLDRCQWNLRCRIENCLERVGNWRFTCLGKRGWSFCWSRSAQWPWGHFPLFGGQLNDFISQLFFPWRRLFLFVSVRMLTGSEVGVLNWNETLGLVAHHWFCFG